MTVTASDLVGELLDNHMPADAPWAASTTAGGSTWRELRTQVAALTRLFRIQGIRPGATVALHMRPSYTMVWSLLALWNAGAQVLLLDIVGRDAHAALTRWRPQFHVRSGGFGPAAAPFVRECEVVVYCHPRAAPARTDHCLLQLTAGRTAPARTVGRDPVGLLAELERFGSLPDAPGAGERVLLSSPLARPTWLVPGLLHAIACGATVLIPEREGAGGPLPGSATGVDVLLTTPSGVGPVLDGSPVPGSLRLAVAAGGPLPSDAADRFRQRFGTALGTAYGTTETGLVACDLTGEHRTPSLGPVLPGVRTRIRGGELQVLLDRSPEVAAPATRPTWLATGDRAVTGPRGDLVLAAPAEPGDPAPLAAAAR